MLGSSGRIEDELAAGIAALWAELDEQKRDPEEEKKALEILEHWNGKLDTLRHKPR